jgi:hypothetical protein
VVELSAWVNLSNRIACLEAGMPIPVSSLASELDGVTREVEQDLAQPPGIAGQVAGHVRIGQADELQAGLVGANGDDGSEVIEEAAQVEVDTLQLEPAGLDLAEVEDVVDKGQERIGRRSDGLGEAALGGIERRVQQEPGHADHAVHRRPDLVAHVGQEIALGLVGGVGRGGQLDGPAHGDGELEVVVPHLLLGLSLASHVPGHTHQLRGPGAGTALTDGLDAKPAKRPVGREDAEGHVEVLVVGEGGAEHLLDVFPRVLGHPRQPIRVVDLRAGPDAAIQLEHPIVEPETHRIGIEFPDSHPAGLDGQGQAAAGPPQLAVRTPGQGHCGVGAHHHHDGDQPPGDERDGRAVQHSLGREDRDADRRQHEGDGHDEPPGAFGSLPVDRLAGRVDERRGMGRRGCPHDHGGQPEGVERRWVEREVRQRKSEVEEVRGDQRHHAGQQHGQPGGPQVAGKQRAHGHGGKRKVGDGIEELQDQLRARAVEALDGRQDQELDHDHHRRHGDDERVQDAGPVHPSSDEEQRAGDQERVFGDVEDVRQRGVRRYVRDEPQPVPDEVADGDGQHPQPEEGPAEPVGRPAEDDQAEDERGRRELDGQVADRLAVGAQERQVVDRHGRSAGRQDGTAQARHRPAAVHLSGGRNSALKARHRARIAHPVSPGCLSARTEPEPGPRPSP